MSHHKTRIKSARVLSEVLNFGLCNTVPQAVKYLKEERGLDPELASELGIKAIVSETSGEPIFFFPVHAKGKVKGYVQVDTSKPKKTRFSTIGDVNADGEFFGQSLPECKPHGKKKVIVTEGVWDWVAVTQGMREYSKSINSNYKTPVIAITLGTPSAADQVSSNIQYLQGFAEVIVAFDNDARQENESKEIVRGQDAAEQVSILIPHMRNILWCENDANDVLREHGFKEIAEAYFNAHEYEPTSLFQFRADMMDWVMKPLEEGFRFSCIPKTDAMIKGMRSGELMVILAPSGVGKTLLAKNLAYDVLTNSDEQVGFVFLEEDKQKAIQSYVSIREGIALPRLRENPELIPEEKQREFGQWLESKKAWFIDHEGSLDIEKLMTTFRHLHIKGCTTVVFDHFHMVLSADKKSQNMVKMIDNALAEMAAFTTQTGMKIISVAHIKRVEKPRPTKAGEEPEPYFLQVRKEDARGSAAFEQYADIILCLEPEIRPDGERGSTRIVVDKNREWGTLGIGDYLRQDEMTGRYHTVKHEY